MQNRNTAIEQMPFIEQNGFQLCIVYYYDSQRYRFYFLDVDEDFKVHRQRLREVLKVDSLEDILERIQRIGVKGRRREDKKDERREERREGERREDMMEVDQPKRVLSRLSEDLDWGDPVALVKDLLRGDVSYREMFVKEYNGYQHFHKWLNRESYNTELAILVLDFLDKFPFDVQSLVESRMVDVIGQRLKHSNHRLLYEKSKKLLAKVEKGYKRLLHQSAPSTRISSFVEQDQIQTINPQSDSAPSFDLREKRSETRILTLPNIQYRSSTPRGNLRYSENKGIHYNLPEIRTTNSSNDQITKTRSETKPHPKIFTEICRYYNRPGGCHKRDSCTFIHDRTERN
eukprot:TRINITY_DN9559_c0_g1_i1.p1 TRINITY_DN9559_c0_g1~~TRINITY_DN9559_c0_g1_i1.p1  ORF type:complete len:345 (+),score=67.82 TRINITY_DN9559_c0_g1_i1:30-1064(+)